MILFNSDDESFSDFDGFTYDDTLGETSDLNGPNEGIEHEIRNRTTSWSSALTDIGVDAFVQPVGAVNILANDAKEISFF